jgi:hypothetical protein
MMHLERRLNDLRAQRVAARKAIERAPWAISDFIDRRRFIELQQMMLRGTEREWEELHCLLGKRLPGPAVKLAPRPRELAALQRQRQAAQAPVRTAPVRVKAAPPSARGYLTRMLGSR